MKPRFAVRTSASKPTPLRIMRLMVGRSGSDNGSPEVPFLRPIADSTNRGIPAADAAVRNTCLEYPQRARTGRLLTWPLATLFFDATLALNGRLQHALTVMYWCRS
jgi:hypothetical protein